MPCSLKIRSNLLDLAIFAAFLLNCCTLLGAIGHRSPILGCIWFAGFHAHLVLPGPMGLALGSPCRLGTCSSKYYVITL